MLSSPAMLVIRLPLEMRVLVCSSVSPKGFSGVEAVAGHRDQD